MNVAIVGGGITGLSIAGQLAGLGHRVTLFEKGRIGGQALGFPYRKTTDVFLEKFSHHVLPSDTAILDLITEQGLSDDLLWVPVRSGLIARGKVWPFNSPLDLLCFSPLGSLWQRLVTGWHLRNFSRTEDWKRLDGMRCREFFERQGNLAGYRALFEPLLKQKYADRVDDLPASVLWGRIQSQTRSGRHGTVLGYLRGGFQRLFAKMVDAVVRAGGRVEPQSRVVEVQPGPRPKIVCDGQTRTFDRVVWTASANRLKNVVKGAPPDWAGKAQATDHLAATELILVMRRRQSEYYWLHSMDSLISFCAVIEHTNLAPSTDYRGEHVLYVVNYHRQNDPQFAGKSAESLLRYHLPSLQQVVPGFRRSDILRAYSMRDACASPLYDLGFAERRPPWQGWLANVDVCEMAQVYPEVRTMSQCVDNARRYVAECFQAVPRRRELKQEAV